jgi:glycosyltransferase involved in cell wall biosynthesis
MTLVFVITDYGSFNNFLSELALKLDENEDFKLHVICSRNKIIDIGDKFDFNNSKIQFHFLEIRRKVNLYKTIQVSLKIRQIIKHIKPDLVHCHFTTGIFPTVLFKLKKTSYWGTFHGLGFNATTGIKQILFTVIEVFSCFRLNKIFVLNDKDYRTLIRLFPQKVIKYKSLGVGCDIEIFEKDYYSSNERDQLREKLGIQKHHTVIAFTGRFVNFKGFDIVIKTFIKLLEKYPNQFKLILMGGEDIVHKTGLNDDEFFFYKNNTEVLKIGYTNYVNKYLSISNIFFFPSKKEGIPTCVLEALSIGLPIIAFNERGNNDIVINNYNGLLINSQHNRSIEEEEIFLAIEELTFNKAKYDYLQNNALKDRSNYSREKFIRENIFFYQNKKN